MSEQQIKRRGWVKNAAIVFLSVMLVLTLFSNTIMNRSLPEVATQTVMNGAITARIRGNGAITANETYDVKISQTRDVDSIGVRAGDRVEIGDVMFRLSDKDSAELEHAKAELERMQSDLQKKLIGNIGKSYAREYTEIQRAEEDLQAAKDQLGGNYVEDSEIIAARNELQAELDEISALEVWIAQLEEQLEAAEPGEPGTENIERQLREAKDNLAAAQTRRAAAQTKLDELYARRQAYEMAYEEIKRLQRSLEDKRISLADQQRQDGVTNALTNFEIQEASRAIAEQEQLVAKLEREAVGADLLAQVSGIVKNVYVTTGGQAQMNQTLATIEIVERGYSVTIPVTVEQSQKVRLGETAEVSGYYYWGSQITATLIQIKANPDNPQGGRLLVFDIGGDVESGASLSLSIGERSRNYEFIVPNSAVRRDSSGEFVLIIVSKSSPVGTRYVATRVDVQVLAKDDVNSAISGGITNWDYVVTSSSKPLEPGMLVRMADNM